MAVPPLHSATIARGPPPDAGRDYEALRREGIDLVQAYSGSIWTDYNEHDPGVTILEQLCYALTELSYRAALPVADILADPDGSLQTVAGIFYRPSRILPAEPVTIMDYRRLLIDRVQGLANVWLEPRAAAGEAGPTGLYDISLYAAPPVPGRFERFEPDRRVAARAGRVFVRHRALCEDIGSMRTMRPVRTVVSADVAIEQSAWPEQVMAEVIQRLACYLAPEPRRRPLEDLVAEGRLPADIFEGPLLINGFIDPDDLSGPRRQVAATDLDDQIACVPGVLGVDALKLWIEPRRRGEPGRLGEAVLEPGQYFSLDAGLDAKILPIRLIVDGHPCRIDADDVLRILRRLWVDHRRAYRLGPDCRRFFPPAAGRYRPLADYAPVATQFPALYGIGGRSLPREASPERLAQAKQLEAYLALFDRLMADYLDRLANMRPLLAAAALDQSAFARPLADIVPGIEALLIDGGPDADTLSGRQAFSIDQQSRLADFLLGLYGEDPEPLIPRLPEQADGGAEARRRLTIKRALLHRLIAAGKGRGRGMDYDARRSRRHLSGVELRSRIMLGGETHEGGRTRPRMSVVEHVLLRPRARGACAEDAPEGDAMTITAVVHLPGEPAERASRRQVETMIRANTPAHIRLRTFFVDREHWVRFRRLHRIWREALGEDMPEAIDCVSAELRRRFDLWAAEEG
jgi:hypothetical protein